MEPTNKWTDADWDKFKDFIKNLLVTNTVTVTFIKKDGSERVMKCTLKPSQIPITENKEGKKTRKISEDTLAVFDVEQNGWRSFTIKSVKRVEATI